MWIGLGSCMSLSSTAIAPGTAPLQDLLWHNFSLICCAQAFSRAVPQSQALGLTMPGSQTGLRRVDLAALLTALAAARSRSSDICETTTTRVMADSER